MRNRSVAMAITLLCVMAMVSCTHEPQDIAVPVSFNKDILPILETNCAINSSCHAIATNTNGGINLDSAAAYSTIVNKQLVMISNPAASLLYVEVSSGTMPKEPYSRLSQSQVSLILEWIKQGAKNN